MPEERIFNYTYDVRDSLESFQCIDGEDKDHPDTLFFGIELEIQSSTFCRTQADSHRRRSSTELTLHAMYEVMDKFALAKADISIGRDGFEIVTVPATKRKQEEVWNTFFHSNARKLSQSWPTETCGMHVHMGKDKFSSLTLGKLMMFYNQPKNSEFIFSLSGRSKTQLDKWSALKPELKLSSGYGKPKTPHNDRSQAVNISNRGTIEIRIFRGNVQQEGFQKNLEAVQAIFRFCQAVTAKQLSHENFCEWLQDSKHASDYLHLIEWSKAHGYIGTTENVKLRLDKTYAKGE